MENMRPQEHVVDVAILGGGPAGCAAAIELARAGRRVTVIEQKPFPRNKVCGGCLSGAGVAQVRRLLGPDVPVPGIETRRISFILPSGHCIRYRPRGEARLVRRADFDAALADESVRQGAEVRYGQRAHLLHRGDRWSVRFGDTILNARYVLVAAGLGAGHKALGIEGTPPGRTKSTMIGLQWMESATDRHPALGEVQMHWLVGGYIGLATAETRRCNVALALDDPNRSALKPLQQLRERNGNAPIWSILAGSDARADAVEGAAGFPSRPVAYGKDNVLMIGDAAGYAEPFTGEGIALAMLSAALATRAICTSGDVQNTYQRLMRRVHAPALRRCRRLGRLLRCRCLEKLDARLPRGWDSWLPSLIEYVHVRSRR